MLKFSTLVGTGIVSPMVLGLYLSFFALFLHLLTTAPLWERVLLCLVSLQIDLSMVWHGLGRWRLGGIDKLYFLCISLNVP